MVAPWDTRKALRRFHQPSETSAVFPTFGERIASLSKGGTEKSEKHWNLEAVRRSPIFFQCLDMAKCCKSATLVVNVQPRLGKIY